MRRLLTRCRRFIQSILFWTETPAPSGTILPTLHFNERRERLDTQGAGARDGARNHPPSSARAPGSFEHDIVQDITQDVDKAAANCQQVLSELAADMQVNQFAHALIGVKARLDRVSTTLLLAASCRPQEIHLLVTGLQDQIGELDAFKRDRRLTRPSREPESRLALIVFLVLLVVLESVMNGTLFSISLDGGWLQGVLYALTLSVVNVGVGWLAGRGGLPLTNAKRLLPRALGWLSVVLFAGWVVTLNLAVAHYRNSLASLVPDPGHVAIVTLVSQPLHLPDLNAWLLLIVGIVFGYLAYWDGYRFGDPQHGFGQLTRAVRRAHEDCEEAIDDWKVDLEAARDMGIELLESAGRELALGARQIAYAHARQRDLMLRFAGFLREAEQICQMLIDDYRAANLAARSEPPPAYFATRAVLAPVSLEPIALDPIDMSEALETLDSYRKELNDRFFAAITAAGSDLDEEWKRYVTQSEDTENTTK